MRMLSRLRLVPACLLGVGAAVLVSCGSSSKGLIPLGYAGPLQSDFQAVLQAAQEGDGNCTATEAKIRETEHDLQALPSSVDSGLRGRLAEGVANLSVRARVLCTQPLSQATTTTETTTVTAPPPSTSTQPTATSGAPSTTPTTGTPPTPTTAQPEGEEGGGTQAPGPGNGNGRGRGDGSEGGGSQGNGAEQPGGESEAGRGTGGTGGGQ
jgi:hypothetical protein